MRFLEKRLTLSLVLVALALLFEYYFLGPYSYVRLGDNLDWSIPRHEIMARYLKEFGLQGWVRELGGGVDAASFDARYFSIVTLIFYIFGFKAGYPLIFILSFILAAVFLKKLMVERLKVSPLAAFVGGATYLTYMAHDDIIPLSTGWTVFPMAVYFLYKAFESRLPVGLVIAIFSGTLFCFFTTVAAANLYLTAGVLGFFLVFPPPRTRNAYGVLITFFATIGAWKLPEIRHLASIASYSSRIGHGYYSNGLQGYIGLVSDLLMKYRVPLAFCLVSYGVAAHGPSKKVLKRLIATSLIIILVAQLYGLAFPILKAVIGVFADFPLNRFAVILPIVFALATALGTDLISERSKLELEFRSVAFKPLAIVAYFLFLAMFISGFKTKHFKDWLVSNSNLSWLRNTDLQTITRRTNEPFRVELINDKYGSFIPSLAALTGLETMGGEINLPSARFQAYWRLMEGEDSTDSHSFSLDSGKPESFNLTLLGLANVRFLASTAPIANADLNLVNRPPFTQCDPEGSLSEKISCKFKAVFAGHSIYIYENRRALPRFFVVGQVRAFPSKDELLGGLGKAQLEEVKKAAFVEKNLIQPDWELFDGPLEGVSIDLQTYSPDRIQLKVRMPRSGILITTNNYTPHWQVQIDGAPSTIIPVYHTFWGVYLRPGEHTVEFTY